jgi:predicted pyridoxine 5'-phosphate oxidase superfamily flavin-nucleotide-binding protein
MGAYHEGHRALQDQHDTRRLADRLEEITYHQTFSDGDRAMIEAAPFFLLGTADGEGRPDVSYKGGMPGFVRCVGDHTLEIPTYDGNGQFRSLGNILVNPHVSLLFIDFQSPNRLRIQGQAALGEDMTVRVEIDQIWPNCPRYIHRMRIEEFSPHAPRDDYEPPEAEWKQYFTDFLPKR